MGEGFIPLGMYGASHTSGLGDWAVTTTAAQADRKEPCLLVE